MTKIECSVIESSHLTPGEVHRKINELWIARRFDEALQLIATDVVDHWAAKLGTGLAGIYRAKNGKRWNQRLSRRLLSRMCPRGTYR
jgi:hypothetical protein